VTERPLLGRRVLVTRHAPSLTRRLADLGATVVEVPAIAIEPPDDPRPLEAAIADLDAYAWIVFTSANAVRAVAASLRAAGRTLPGPLRIASVGAATSAAIAEDLPGRASDLQPEAAQGEALVDAFRGVPLGGLRVLLPASDRAAPTLERGLGALGAQVDRVTAYRTALAASPAGLAALLAQGVDIVAFASPSAVEGFMAAAGDGARGLAVAAIGPTTAAAAREAGLRVVAEAVPSTLDGLENAIVRRLTPRG
jgi:uroporphyrinogen III methyltransferase/synthase